MHALAAVLLDTNLNRTKVGPVEHDMIKSSYNELDLELIAHGGGARSFSAGAIAASGCWALPPAPLFHSAFSSAEASEEIDQRHCL